LCGSYRRCRCGIARDGDGGLRQTAAVLVDCFEIATAAAAAAAVVVVVTVVRFHDVEDGCRTQ